VNASSSDRPRLHVLETNTFVFEPEEGQLLGNGDLSVSIYQRPGRVVWRLGKNDVWDRRLDVSDGVEAAHIDEIARGVVEEGWVNHGWTWGHGEATKGTPKDPKRMKEITDGWPAYACRPYPCPKPVGELVMHLPVDLLAPRVRQRVVIEKGEGEIECSWEGGVTIRARWFVPPRPNALAVEWRVENWNEKTTSAGGLPVWFSVRRWADPTVEAFASRLYADFAYRYFEGSIQSGKVTPLPPPETRELDGRPVIEQRFHPDVEFKDGFRCVMQPFATGSGIEAVEMHGCQDAILRLRGEQDGLEGWVAVGVPTSTDEGGAEAEAKRIAQEMSSGVAPTMERWLDATHKSAAEFWGRSAIEIDDPIIEKLWYGVLHGRRCTYRAGVVAPGLALPSTVADYSLWHGDYHTNFNYQQPFWGDCTANHVELWDAFFPGMQHMVDIGRKLARDYWNCRGTYIAIAGYPFPVEHDTYGTGNCARMAYMTGWIANHYWIRYLYTRDLDWLREHGYPVMRDCALFYTDFLKKWDDGRYHAFPSIQGEQFYSAKPEDYTDQPQVLRHARYCFQSAIQAGELLGEDTDLRADWQDRLDHMVQTDDLDAMGFSDEEKRRYRLNLPEFTSLDMGHSIPQPGVKTPFLATGNRGAWMGGTNGLPWPWMLFLRARAFEPDAAVDSIRHIARSWQLPSGVLRAMSAGSHGFIGTYGEGMGIIAPIQEMMLQSWDEVIRVFPAWPKALDASFTTFRAEGAFLVSGSWRDARVQEFSIHSELGGPCRVENPWPGEFLVTDDTGKAVRVSAEPRNVLAFDIEAGRTYRFSPTKEA